MKKQQPAPTHISNCNFTMSPPPEPTANVTERAEAAKALAEAAKANAEAIRVIAETLRGPSPVAGDYTGIKIGS